MRLVSGSENKVQSLHLRLIFTISVRDSERSMYVSGLHDRMASKSLEKRKIRKLYILLYILRGMIKQHLFKKSAIAVTTSKMHR